MTTHSYHRGDKVAIPGTRAIAIVDDRLAPDAALALAIAFGSGDAAGIARATEVLPPASGAVAWEAADGWHLHAEPGFAAWWETDEARHRVEPTGGPVHHRIAGPIRQIGVGIGAVAPTDLDPVDGTAVGPLRADAIHLNTAPAAPKPAAAISTVPAASVIPPAEPDLGTPAHATVAAAAPLVAPSSSADAQMPSLPPAEPAGAPAETASGPSTPPEPTANERQLDSGTQLIELSGPIESPAPLAVGDTAPTASRADVQVLGVRCPVDHHNHPDALYCSQCGRKMGVNRTAIALPGPRPPLGLLLIDAIGTHPVAADFIIGRDPKGHPDAGPSALRLDDPDRQVSRVHAKVHLDGWDVYATDLNSANGTQLRQLGSSNWQPLVADQPVRVEAGDVLRIGSHELQLELHHVQT